MQATTLALTGTGVEWCDDIPVYLRILCLKCMWYNTEAARTLYLYLRLPVSIKHNSNNYNIKVIQ